MTFEEKVLAKIDSGEELTVEEIQELVYEYSIFEQEGERQRWYVGVTTIAELGGRCFRINWDRGLTEAQPDRFPIREPREPEEVTKVETEKLVKVVEWVPKGVANS